MLLAFATLALLTFYISLGIGAVLLWRRGGGWRVVSVVLLLQALLAFAAQVTLSTLPFGIGEPLIRVQFEQLATQTLITFLAVGAVAGLTYLVVRWIGRGMLGRGQRQLATAGLLLLVPLVAASSMYGMARASLPERERERDPNKRQIQLPEGFQAQVYAQGTMDNPTVITFGADEKLYIGDISGSLWVAEDADKDYSVDTITRWASGFDLLLGLAWREDELFVASSGKIEALRDTDGNGEADKRRTVVEGLPSMILRPHSNNSIVFGPDDRLYFGVGSTTSGQFESNELAASVLSVNPDGSDLKVFARGFGNTFDIAFNKDGELFGGDNSPMGGDRSELPDEFNHIVENQHYGFPYFYGDEPQTTIGALSNFPAHSAPTGATFYSGSTFPQEYSDNAFVTLWQRGEIARVEVARTSGGKYLSRVSTFGSGFLYPLDAVTGPDGNLYIADFGTSAIYRITYNG
jgi:glucose/arabinose dehydrogenase